jgi:hypothetical protein
MKMNKFELYLSHLEHELKENDILIIRFKELFKKELNEEKK